MLKMLRIWEFRRTRPTLIPISRQELERTTDICYTDPDMENIEEVLESNEACLVELRGHQAVQPSDMDAR